MGGAWLQASPASNRFFLEETTTGELGRSASDAFTARTSWEFYTTTTTTDGFVHSKVVMQPAGKFNVKSTENT